MPRCADQRHIRGRPSTQIVHRIRWHRSITPRTRAPGPKLLTTRANRGDIAGMSTGTSGGPSGVPGLLDHEAQIRPRAQKNQPHRGKGSATANFHDCNGAARTKTHTLLLRSLSGASLPFDPYNRAVMCHLCCLLACLHFRKILAKRTSRSTATGCLPRVTPSAECTHAVVGFRRASPCRSSEAASLREKKVGIPGTSTAAAAGILCRGDGGGQVGDQFVTKPPRHVAEPSGNTETARCSASRLARTWPQRVGLCATAACRLVEPFDRVRRHRRLLAPTDPGYPWRPSHRHK
jgi:hypothetical protein